MRAHHGGMPSWMGALPRHAPSIFLTDSQWRSGWMQSARPTDHPPIGGVHRLMKVQYGSAHPGKHPMRVLPFRRLAFTLVLCVLPACTSTPPRMLTDDEALSTATLMVGQPAPDPELETWARGEPVGAFQPGTVYVLDFWATWCGPCLASMPHLSELQDHYAEDVVVIAVGTVDNESTPTRIRRVADLREDRMRFRVAIDEDGSATEAYRVSVRDMGIPRAFIIDRQGRLAWHGHPADMDPALAAVVDGSWDLDAAAARDRLRDEAARTTRAAVRDYLATEDPAAQLEAVEIVCRYPAELAEGMSPPYWALVMRPRFLLRADRTAEALEAVQLAAQDPMVAEDPVPLAELARMTASHDPALAGALADMSLALIDAEEQSAPTTDWDAYMRGASRLRNAVALFDIAAVRAGAGRYAEAVALQRRGLSVWPSDHWLVPRRPDLEVTLKQFEAQAAEHPGR